MATKLLTRAFIALSMLFIVNASDVVLRRTQPTPGPSCVDFTPFVYGGCFADDRGPRTLTYTSNLEFDTMTVGKCVAFCKGNNYKYAGLEYYGECFCGASVNAMQIDESSCKFPCTGNKTESCGGNKAVSTYQDPTFPVVDKTTIADYMHMGCYSEGFNGRALAWKQNNITGNTLTVERCLFACKDGGYAFAGVEFGRECFCGVVLGNGTSPLAAEECDMRCTGDKTQFCGGRGALNLYVARNLESTEPCNQSPEPNSSSSSFSTISTTAFIGSSSPTVLPTSATPTTTTSDMSRILITTPSSSGRYLSPSSMISASNTPLSASSTASPTTFTPGLTSTSSDKSSSSTTSTRFDTTSTSTSTLSSAVLPTPFTTSTVTPLRTTTPVLSFTSTTTSSISTQVSSRISFTSPSPTSSYPPLSTFSASSPSPSLCTSTYTIYPPLPTPVCQYKLGKWCAKLIPEFSDTFTCLKSFASCASQLSSCFRDAGYPYNLGCNKFTQYCSRIASFCSDFCPGPRCSVTGCNERVPAEGVPPVLTSLSGTRYTTSYICDISPSSTTRLSILPTLITTKASVTATSRQHQASYTSLLIPSYTNICNQPNNPANGYGVSKPVGGIPLPKLSCNNDLPDYNSGNLFKLYTFPDSYKCPSYDQSKDSGPAQACLDACKEQFNLCLRGYAEPYKNLKMVKRGVAEDFYSASNRCANQRDDCYLANEDLDTESKCGAFDSGY